MIKLTYNILRLLRPRQWVKNFALFASITFAGELFNIITFEKVLLSFFVFCGLASSTYIMNDVFDVKKDRLHPFKKFRPIAHNDVPIPIASALAIFLILFSLIVAKTITPGFFAISLTYLFMQFMYSSFVKSIAVLDILLIAAGYILRVYAGEFASGFHISVWLLLTTISISLFLAIGKRRSELTLLLKNKDSNLQETRKSLMHYSEKLLDIYAAIFATSTFITYSLFTFLENPGGFKLSIGVFLPDFLPTSFQRKWLMITIIPVVYGLMRYIQDIYEKDEGESPEKVLFSDKPLLITVAAWAIMVIFLIYFIS